MLEPTDLFQTPPVNDRQRVAQQIATDMAWFEFRATLKAHAGRAYDALMESLPQDTVCEE